MLSAFPTSHFARHSAKPVFVNGQSNSDSFFFSGVLDINTPTGVRAGDVMFALVGAHNSSDISPGGGWSVVFQDAQFIVQGEDRSVGLYYRRAAVSEPASHGFAVVAQTFGTCYACGSIVAYRRVSVKKGFVTSFDRSSVTGTSHDYIVPSGARDQLPVLLTGWHAMKSGNGSSVPSSSMTARADAEVSGGQDYARVSFFDQELTGPSDPLIGTNVNVSYDQSIDIETYGIILEGSYA